MGHMATTIAFLDLKILYVRWSLFFFSFFFSVLINCFPYRFSTFSLRSPLSVLKLNFQFWISLEVLPAFCIFSRLFHRLLSRLFFPTFFSPFFSTPLLFFPKVFPIFSRALFRLFPWLFSGIFLRLFSRLFTRLFTQLFTRLVFWLFSPLFSRLLLWEAVDPKLVTASDFLNIAD